MENLRISTIQNSMIRTAAQILPGTGCYSGKVSECPGRRACIFFPSDRYSAGRIFRAAYENRLLSGCMTRNNQRGIHFSRPCIFPFCNVISQKPRRISPVRPKRRSVQNLSRSCPLIAVFCAFRQTELLHTGTEYAVFIHKKFPYTHRIHHPSQKIPSSLFAPFRPKQSLLNLGSSITMNMVGQV